MDTPTTGEALAARLVEATERLLGRLEPLTVEAWARPCETEERSVGVLAHHIAANYVPVARWVERLGRGEGLLDVTMASVNRDNAQHAAEYAACTRADTLALIHEQSEAAASLLRGLDDEAYERSGPVALFGGQPMRAREFAELVLIGHIEGQAHSHLPRIERALEGG